MLLGALTRPNEFDRLFMSPFMGLREMYEPDLRVSQTDDAFKIEADVPGMGPDDIEVEITNSLVRVQATRDNRTYRFGRRFSTRLNPDEATATVENGVLTMMVPKMEATGMRRIPVMSGTPQIEAMKEE